MNIGFVRKINTKTGEHNNYRHLILYKLRADRTLDIKISVPLFII